VQHNAHLHPGQLATLSAGVRRGCRPASTPAEPACINAWHSSTQNAPREHIMISEKKRRLHGKHEAETHSTVDIHTVRLSNACARARSACLARL